MISRVMNSSCSIEVGSLSTSFSHYKEHAAGIYPYRFQCRLKRECRYDTRQLEADGYTEVYVIHDILVVSLACAGIARVFARLINGKELLCRNYERLAVFVSNNHVLF